MSEREINRDGYRVVIKGRPCVGAYKDVRCLVCHTEHAELVRSVAWEKGKVWCTVCEERTAHVALASGGTRSRYRYMDGFAGVTGHCEYKGLLPAQDDQGRDYEDPDADSKAHKYTAELREERRQQINADKARKRGSAPLFFDNGK